MLPIHVVEQGRTPLPGLFLAQQIRFFIYLALQLWLVLKTPCLGSHPECNKCVQTVPLFGTLAVHIWPRSARLFVVLCVSTFWINGFMWTYGPKNYFQTFSALISRSSSAAWTSHTSETQTSLRVWRERQMKIHKAFWNLPRLDQCFEDHTTAAQAIKKRRWTQAPCSQTRKSSLRTLLSDAVLMLRVARCQRALLALLIAVVNVVVNEQTIKVNLARSANDWGYGQIASMVLSVPSALGSKLYSFS